MPFYHLKEHAKSYKYATDGIFHTLRTQSNIYVQLPVGVIVLVAAWYFQVEIWEWVVLILTISAVLVAELFNTAVEAMMNVIQGHYDLNVKVAKDVAAGGVLVMALASVVVGLLIFGPRILQAI
ncbi:diacylglycerol kinase family protein [Patescibacteria group bacterium]|nr:diacylglycerol kinase family protein [Patescibacteria group bacterium]